MDPIESTATNDETLGDTQPEHAPAQAVAEPAEEPTEAASIEAFDPPAGPESAEPTEPATEPAEPTEPATEPAESAVDAVAPTEPAEPTEPATEPAESAVDAVAPTEPGQTGDQPGVATTASGLRSGQLVEARVIAVDAAEVVVELGDGSIGVIGKRHLSANGQLDPTALLAVGDGVEAAVLVRDDPKGRTVLSRAWALKQRAWEKVEAAKAANAPITGNVTGQVKGGLVVDVGTRAFLPASQIDLQHVDDLSTFVGTEIEALVQELDRANDKIVLSRRNLLRAAQRAKANDFVSTLAPGQVHTGRVALLTDFGAFIEINGVRGLVHLSELSWRRVDRAAEVVTTGDEVDVKILAIKPGRKLSLSIRAISPDPLSTLQNGQILPGVVTRLADFGAFVRVGDGAEGLVHLTELAEYRVHAPEEIVAPGDEVLVKVIRVDRKRRRLDLSVNQAVLS